jgi:hypothetical protein
MLGPMVNILSTKNQLVGVFNLELARCMLTYTKIPILISPFFIPLDLLMSISLPLLPKDHSSKMEGMLNPENF